MGEVGGAGEFLWGGWVRRGGSGGGGGGEGGWVDGWLGWGGDNVGRVIGLEGKGGVVIPRKGRRGGV